MYHSLVENEIPSADPRHLSNELCACTKQDVNDQERVVADVGVSFRIDLSSVFRRDQ